MLLSFVLFLFSTNFIRANTFGQESARCEPLANLQPGICTNVVYNSTVRPNRFGHINQAETYTELLQYKPLFNVNCSPYFQQFICTLYLPPCVQDPSNKNAVTLMEPCYELCELARRNCEQLLVSFGVPWPKPLECTGLPRSQLGSFVSADAGVGGSEVPSLCIPPIDVPDDGAQSGSFHPFANDSKCPLMMQSKPGMDYQFIHPLTEVEISDCGLTCRTIRRLYTTPEQLMILRYTMLSLAIVTCCSTLFTLLTFLMDLRRFRYPERPIIYMSLCYLIVSIVHITAFSLGDSQSVACTTILRNEQEQDPQPDDTSVNHLMTQGTRNEGCTVMFIFLYFFT